MNKERILIVFGSAVRGENPRDIDIAHEGEFGPEEVQIIRLWAAERGLPADLPLDIKDVGNLWRDSPMHSFDGWLPHINLPTYRSREEGGDAIVLRGKCKPDWHRSYELPARIRACVDVYELLALLRDPGFGTRMATLVDTEGQEKLRNEIGAYVQGRLALRNAIAKCPFWDLAERLDARVEYVRHLADDGIPTAARELMSGGFATMGGDAWVSLDGIRPTHGRLFSWSEIYP